MSIPITTIRDQPKLKQACARLELLIEELGIGQRLPTVQELRAELGVSLTTLNSALDLLSERGILERRNGVGVFVARPQVRNIALLCDPCFLEGAAHSPLWNALTKGLRERAEAHGETIEFHFSRPIVGKNGPISDGLSRQLAQNRVHGVLGLGLHLETMEWLQNAGVPTVGFACWGNEQSHQVNYAHDEKFYEVAALVLQEQGCQHIEAWFPVMNWMWPNYRGCEEHWSHLCELFSEQIATASKASGVQLQPRFLPGLASKDEPKMSHQEQGFTLVKQAFSGQQNGDVLPDGIIFWDDMMAHGALLALHQLDIAVGRELKIVAQSNAGSPVLEREFDEITRLEYDPQQVVALMVEQLELLMSGEKLEPENRLIAFTCNNSSRFQLAN